MPEATKGPWAVKRLHGWMAANYEIIAPRSSDSECDLAIAHVYGSEANAHLMACAPDLLKACKATLEQFRTLRDKHGEVWDSVLLAEPDIVNLWDLLKAVVEQVEGGA